MPGCITPCRAIQRAGERRARHVRAWAAGRPPHARTHIRAAHARTHAHTSVTVQSGMVLARTGVPLAVFISASALWLVTVTWRFATTKPAKAPSISAPRRPAGSPRGIAGDRYERDHIRRVSATSQQWRQHHARTRKVPRRNRARGADCSAHHTTPHRRSTLSLRSACRCLRAVQALGFRRAAASPGAHSRAGCAGARGRVGPPPAATLHLPLAPAQSLLPSQRGTKFPPQHVKPGEWSGRTPRQPTDCVVAECHTRNMGKGGRGHRFRRPSQERAWPGYRPLHIGCHPSHKSERTRARWPPPARGDPIVTAARAACEWHCHIAEKTSALEERHTAVKYTLLPSTVLEAAAHCAPALRASASATSATSGLRAMPCPAVQHTCAAHLERCSLQRDGSAACQ